MGDFNLETANATPDVLARHTAAEGLRAKGVGEEFISAHLPLTGDAQRLKAGAEKALARWGEVHPAAGGFTVALAPEPRTTEAGRWNQTVQERRSHGRIRRPQTGGADGAGVKRSLFAGDVCRPVPAGYLRPGRLLIFR